MKSTLLTICLREKFSKKNSRRQAQAKKFIKTLSQMKKPRGIQT